MLTAVKDEFHFRTLPILGAIILLLLAVTPLRAASVSTDKGSYLVLQPVVITYSGFPGNATDWISLALAGDKDGSNGIQWVYTAGKTSGTLSFEALQSPGTYEVRAYFNSGLAVQARTSFTVIYPTPTISTDKSTYQVLQKIVVTYSNMPGYPKDYITIVAANAPDSVYGEYIFTGAAKNGTMTFTDLPDGKYEVRVHFNNDDTTVRARRSISVVYPVPTLSVNKTSYLVLEKIVVTYANMAGYPIDYITVVPAAAADSVYAQWFYTNGKINGSMTFDDVAPGNYEARVHFANQDTVRARVPFTVSYPSPKISTDKSSYLLLEKIVVTYSNMAGYPNDYITVVPASAADSVYAQWFYTNGAINGTMKFDDLPAGKYEARVHFANQDTVRARAAFTVGSLVPQISTDSANYLVLQQILVTYSNLPGFAKDFITLVPSGSKEEAVGPYFFTNGAKSGTMTFPDQPPGKYEVRVHFNDDNSTVSARSAFTVGYPTPTVSIARSSYLVLEKITVNYSNMPGYAKDFITISPASSADNTLGQWFFTAGAKSGVMTFDDVPPGNYQARVHFNDDNNVVYARASFSVSYPNSTLRTDKQEYQEKESIIVTYSDMPGYAKDYVTLVPAASPDGTYAQYIFTGGSRSGSMTFDPLPAGSYEARVHFNNDDYTVKVRYPFVVKKAASSILVTSISNAASLTPAIMTSGGIAKGSIFTIKGSGLGPGDINDLTTGVAATPPFAYSLAGVTIDVTQGGTTMSAYPLFVWPGRIDAIMPSNMPLGATTITVTYNGSTSDAAPVTVVASNFGAYATNGKAGGRGMLLVQSTSTDPGVQNTNTVTAKPGQVVTLIGTGLGPINAPDNTMPPTGDMAMPLLQVLVGGKAATPMHAGRLANQPGKDRIQFIVPLDAPAGCNTPLQVVTGGVAYSNTVTVAIDPDGKPCSSINPWSGLSEKGGKYANIFLLRLDAAIALAADEPAAEILMDMGLTAFTNEARGGGPLLSLLASIPTLGTCGSLAGSLDIGSAMGSSIPVIPGSSDTAPIQYLDAGQAISVVGPNGTKQMLPSTDDDGNPIIPSMYGGILGGGLDALFGGTSAPGYLDPGAYTISGAGGKDVGPFQVNLTIPPPITWTNKADLTMVDRSANISFNWSGGSESQLVLIAAVSTDPVSKGTSGFLCFIPSSQGNFTVPPSAMANLSTTGSEGSLGALLFGTVPAGVGTTFPADGLDAGLAFYGMVTLKVVEIK